MIQNRAPRSELRCIESELASSEAPKQYIERSSERCQAGLTLAQVRPTLAPAGGRVRDAVRARVRAPFFRRQDGFPQTFLTSAVFSTSACPRASQICSHRTCPSRFDQQKRALHGGRRRRPGLAHSPLDRACGTRGADTAPAIGWAGGGLTGVQNTACSGQGG